MDEYILLLICFSVLVYAIIPYVQYRIALCKKQFDKPERVWLTPFPGVCYRAVRFKKFRNSNLIMYRDIDKKCYYAFEYDLNIVERS